MVDPSLPDKVRLVLAHSITWRVCARVCVGLFPSLHERSKDSNTWRSEVTSFSSNDTLILLTRRISLSDQAVANEIEVRAALHLCTLRDFFELLL